MELDRPATLGAAIRAARKDAGVTLRSFAASMGISASLQSMIEQGDHRPDTALISRMAAALGKDADLWCGMAGRLTPMAEKSLSRLARKDPMFFRHMVERLTGGM